MEMINDLWYEAGEIEAQALRRSSWAKPTTRLPYPRRGGGPRRFVGRALVGLGRRIAA